MKARDIWAQEDVTAPYNACIIPNPHLNLPLILGPCVAYIRHVCFYFVMSGAGSWRLR